MKWDPNLCLTLNPLPAAAAARCMPLYLCLLFHLSFVCSAGVSEDCTLAEESRYIPLGSRSGSASVRPPVRHAAAYYAWDEEEEEEERPHLRKSQRRGGEGGRDA